MTTMRCDETATQAACLQRLAIALSVYPDLEATVRPSGPAPCLAVRNPAAPVMSEMVTVSASGDGALAYMWSWGRRMASANEPDIAAQAIAYVLLAGDAPLDGS